MYQNLNPDKTLVIRIDHEYAQETQVFPDATVVDWAGGDLHEATIREWLEGLDTVVTAETFYDWRIVDWAREMGVRTVLYVMPELLKKELLDGDMPRPDTFWYPTSWQPDIGRPWPSGPVLTVPCEQRPFVDFPTDTARFVHVAGKPALGDRNGTGTLALASKIGRGMSLTVYGQGALPRFNSNVRVQNGPDDKWTMYEQAHVLVMPRRFGGLCLPVIEALSCGLAVMMPDISPNADWPIVKVSAEPDRVIEMPCGSVRTYVTNQRELAGKIVSGQKKVSEVSHFMQRSRDYATKNSWANRRGDFLAHLD